MWGSPLKFKRVSPTRRWHWLALPYSCQTKLDLRWERNVSGLACLVSLEERLSYTSGRSPCLSVTYFRDYIKYLIYINTRRAAWKVLWNLLLRCRSRLRCTNWTKVEVYGESWRKHGIEAMGSPCGGRITRSAQAMKGNEFAPKIPSFSSVY